ncbi:hypothetical protein DZA65_00363 [Dickeya dianthicola]|nr:hypothetical protein DZA65_00363 [Dickeya dianthicola]
MPVVEGNLENHASSKVNFGKAFKIIYNACDIATASY